MADMEHADKRETMDTANGTEPVNPADTSTATTDGSPAEASAPMGAGAADQTAPDAADPAPATSATSATSATPTPLRAPHVRDENERRDNRYESYDATSAPDPYADIADELERQARETLGALRSTMGDLGERVRQTIEYTASLWDDVADPAEPNESDVHELADIKARALARRWVERDFLVEPDLPVGMGVTALQESAVWRVELRERGETRTLVDSSDPYRGARPPIPGPVLPVWDYDFPLTPDLEAGERRERLVGTETLAACATCNGAGNRVCVGCDGKGFTQCPTCHGQGRTTCRRCRGRARIADPAAERRARADKGYVQVQAERLGVNAADWLADLSERLRQDYGVPLPPSGQWAPQAPASGETIPCPDCRDGYLTCSCNNGKLVCPVCQGSARSQCAACAGTGQVIRRREIARRFDTRIASRNLPPDDEADEWITEAMLRKSVGETVWEGATDAMGETAPRAVPTHVWAAARELARANLSALTGGAAATAEQTAVGERRVFDRQARLLRAPITRVEYVFANRPYTFVAVGKSGAERFWSEAFPPRWSRLGRFVQALARDVSGERGPRQIEGDGHHSLRDLNDYRARRQQGDGADNEGSDNADETATAPRLRIVEDAPPPERGPDDAQG